VNNTDFQPGDHLYFQGGKRFAGTIELDCNDSGTSDRRLVVTSYGDGRAVIDGANGSSLRANGCNHLVVRNLNFVGSGRKGGNAQDGICVLDAQWVEIDHVEVSGFRNNGLSADGVCDARITNVYAHENGAAGLSIGYSKRSKNVYIAHCVAKNNPGDPSNLTNHSGNGILVANAEDVVVEYCEAASNGWDMPRKGNGPVGIWAWNSDRVIIQFCISHDNKSPGDDGGGFDLDGGTTNSILQYNLSYNNDGPGYFLCQFPSATVFKNNIIRYNISHNDGVKNNRRSAIDVYSANSNASGCQIYNNTIYNRYGAAVGFAGLPIPNVVFRNNIFICSGDVIAGEAQRGRFENNVYWPANEQGLSFDGYDSLRKWAGATGQETVGGKVIGRYVNPRLVGVDAAMPSDPKKLGEMVAYRLRSDSTCVNTGIPIKHNGGRDFWGNQVPESERPAVGAFNPAPIRLELLFDADWRFHRGDVEGGELETFDHTSWRLLSLPHDWGIEDLPCTQSPFDPNAISAVDGGFTTGGTAWYRKEFTASAEWRGKRIQLQFDGIYMNADVWLNGRHLGNHPYGYTSFWYEVTDCLRFGKKNIFAVRVRNEGINSRWYSGSGIYRHVWLKVVEPVHVATWGTYVTTPGIDESGAKVNVKTKVVNDSPRPQRIIVITRIFDTKGIEAVRVESRQDIQTGTSVQFSQDAVVKSPSLWSTESPSLYTAAVEVHGDRILHDRVEIQFGIRTIAFDAEKGFVLNGEPTLLKGGCVHHDNGPLGAAAYDRAEQRRVELLKASGFNAIRCAHNPPSPAFLDACDRLGMLVIDEAFDMWAEPSKPQDYHLYFEKWWQRDIDSMVLRDRNHPSIILWSIGNEIPNMDSPAVAQTARMLADYVRQLDSTRPVTAAVNAITQKKDPFFAPLDVCGYNYALGSYDSDHQRMPERIIYCSESYPLNACEYWLAVLDRPWVIGDFVWTAFDYLGEASIGWRGYMQEKNFYPWNLAYCGDIDICGWKRPQSYYRDVLWSGTPEISLFVHPPEPSFEPNPKRESWSRWHFDDVTADWTWPGHEGHTFKVDVYSSCDEIELLLNGKSLGKKATNRETLFRAGFETLYEAGSLRVIGYHRGKQAAVAELRTAGKPKKIKLSVDRTRIKADGQDLSYITVELLDAGGIPHPKAENLLTFDIRGPGSIVAVGNANPISTESYKRPHRKAWRGRCLVIIRASRQPGSIVLKASAQGLEHAEVVVSSMP
jgi:beta-galactosidase